MEQVYFKPRSLDLLILKATADAVTSDSGELLTMSVAHVVATMPDKRAYGLVRRRTLRRPGNRY